MRDLETRIERLERKKNPNSKLCEQVKSHFEASDLDIFERVGLLVRLGLLKGEDIAKLIREGALSSNMSKSDSDIK